MFPVAKQDGDLVLKAGLRLLVLHLRDDPFGLLGLEFGRLDDVRRCLGGGAIGAV